MSILKKIKDKTGTIHDLGDSRVDAFETELSGAEHNVPYSPAVLAKTNAIETSVSAHIGNTANPHKVTKAQIGLANVENKSSTQIRSEITKENVTNALGYTPIDESRIGAANGVASLDASGRIPASQIPGGFDNIEEYDNLASFPTTGEEGKIYVAKDTNLTYRWTGSQYVEISPSLALGETATTAYRGDRGKVAYDHSQVSGNSTIHHTHANKELLDSYTQTEADLANAVAKVHEHGNKDVLDGITSDKVTSWDGKEDAFDVLPTTKGGTGTNAASKSELTSELINSLSLETSAPVDADYYVSQYAGGGNTTTSYHRRPVSALWDYIKGKISSVLKLTASDYAGKAATAGTADKAVADNSGNDIETTYATKSELDAKADADKVVATVANAINALDVSSVGGDGKYISAISETDGKISAAATTMDATPTENSTKAVTSGGIKTALNDKFDKYGFFGNTDGKWIGAALSVVGETEVKYWKLCSFKTIKFWSLNFVADVTNARYDFNVFERKIIAIYGSTPGVVTEALEIREGNNKLYSTRGYGNIIYYETSGNNVTIYIKARFAANVSQFCRLVSVLSECSISNLTWYQETTAGTQPENPVKFSLGYKTVKPAGSTSVPVYIGSDGNPTACTDDFVHNGDVTSTYSSTGTAPVNGTAVAAAINAKGIVIKEIGGENVICFE